MYSKVSRPVAFFILVFVVIVAIRRALFFPAAHAMELEVPVACEIGVECFIQNYADADASDNWSDYKCGFLSYEKHKGTDFRLPNYVKMREGVYVIAAASGTVKGVRDGMEDVDFNEIAAEKIKNKECGNGVVVDHGHGWETQYCHMMKNSLLVKSGDKVTSGQKLGKIGLSGQTEFPHLHLSVRYGGKEIDPFTGLKLESGCGEMKNPAWSKKALAQMPYAPTALLNMGIIAKEPEPEKARDGDYENEEIAANSDMIIVWADVMGTFKDDVIVIEITGPEEISRKLENKVEKNQAVRFQYSGLKRTGENWPLGEYKANITLIRDGQDIFTREKKFKIN